MPAAPLGDCAVAGAELLLSCPQFIQTDFARVPEEGRDVLVGIELVHVDEDHASQSREHDLHASGTEAATVRAEIKPLSTDVLVTVVEGASPEDALVTDVQTALKVRGEHLDVLHLSVETTFVPRESRQKRQRARGLNDLAPLHLFIGRDDAAGS